jgi:DNA-binding NtrC family response regulator
VFPLEVPPLRERREDIIPIAQDLLDGWARAGKGGPWSIPDDTKEALTSAPWPGNVRELRNALERATLLRPVGALEVEHLTLRGSGNGVARAAIGKLLTFAEQERDYLATLLERTDGKLYGDDGAAALAGLKPSTLRSKLVKHGLR